MSENELPIVKSEIPTETNFHEKNERKVIYKNKKWIVRIFLVLLLITAIFVLAFITFKILNPNKTATIFDFESCVKAGNPIAESYPATCRDSKGNIYTQKVSPAPEQKELKTYTNPNYDFSFEYPKEGQVVNADGKMSAGVCGNAIKVTPISSYNYVLSVDNYFMVTEQPFKGTISQFIASYPGANLFTTEALNISGADEAVIISKKANANPTDLIKSPFAYTLRIIKKGNEMFTIAAFQNYGNVGGCAPVSDYERDKIINTFTFSPSDNNWKTYSTKSISFEYPDNYQVDEREPNYFVINPKNNNSTALSGVVIYKLRSQTLQESINVATEGAKNIKQTNYKNGVKIVGSKTTNGATFNFMDVLLPYKNDVFIIATSDPNVSEAMFDQVAESLKIN